MRFRSLIFASRRRCSALGNGGYLAFDSAAGKIKCMPSRQQSSIKENREVCTVGAFRQSVNIPGVTIVYDIKTAKRAIQELRRLKDRVHAWDTEATEVGGIAKGDLRSPVTHGRVVCATCFCGDDADFGNGPRLLVDNDGPAAALLQKKFKKYFENPTYKKVFHNYSFDRHLLAREGVRVLGYHADTLHMARFFDTSLAAWEARAQKQATMKERAEMKPVLGSPAASLLQHAVVRSASLGGLTLERKSWSGGASTLHTSVLEQPDAIVPSGYGLKSLAKFFGLTDVDQKEFGELFGASAEAAIDAHNSEESFPVWARYATDDAVLTYRLFDYLHAHLVKQAWHSNVHKRIKFDLLRDKQVARDLLNKNKSVFSAQNETGHSMWDLFQVYMRDFGESLADLEEEGIGVDCMQLERIEAEATKNAEKQQARFVESLSQARGPDGLALVADANFINIRSSQQLQTLLFGGSGTNRSGETLEATRTFQVPKDLRVETSTKGSLRTFDLQGLGLTPVNKQANFTQAGNPSASGAVLQEFAGACSEHSGLAYKQLVSKGFAPEQAELIADALRNLGEARRTRTFVAGFARPMFEYGKHAGRIHPQWKFDTATGRLACRKPNLQNLPSLGNDVYSIRSAFKAGPGNSLIIADYSQLEIRVLAHVANCAIMIEKLTKGGDYHSEVTAEMFDYVALAITRKEVVAQSSDSDGLPTIKEKFSVERQKAKAINFSIIYGKSAATLAEDLNIDLREAEELIDAWYATKPEVKKWKQEVLQSCRQSGSALSLLGRVRTLPLIHNAQHRFKSERAGVNFAIQGSAADVVMATMLRIWKNKKLKNLGFRLVLQVHDEFVLEGPEAKSSEAAEALQELMMHPFDDHAPNFKFRVPLTSDVVIANSFCKA